ncbi:GTP-binding protein 1 [Rhodotorula toruloides]|uniref:GTP-binding protein 1 n=1 Tax=Rhodotorula toruloides TaxID=5286 RepID=A0A511KKI6_RHOTO|nr:GTP-binding protein 1 [Rhodotorula toruloides]
MAARFDKRAMGEPIPSTSTDERPTLRSFQEELQQKARAGRELAHPRRAQDAAGPVKVADKLDELSIDDGAALEGGDRRTLKDRLTNPNEDDVASIATLLDHTLSRRHGELVLQIGSHSLDEVTLLALLELPDSRTLPPADAVVLTPAQIDAILSTLRSAVSLISSDVSILHTPYDDSGKLRADEAARLTPTPSAINDEETAERWKGKALRLLVRKKPEGAEGLLESRVSVVGNVDAGKSSLLGVLTRGRLDDGRGRARVSLFRHKHEIETGRTSSAGNEILGFQPDGKAIVPEEHAKQQATWESIAQKASKVVSFTDLAGHEKYLKTTLAGLTGTAPDFVLLIIGANAGLIGMSKEHLSVALALSLPIVCVITKVDSTPAPVYEQTVKQLVKILKSPGCRKKPVFVNDVGMACELASGFAAEKACPIFRCSNVTGEGLDLLKTFLNVVRPTHTDELYPVNADFEFATSDVYSVPFVGTVVSGVILAGSVRPGDTPLLGPDSVNSFIPAAIKSIQRKRVNVDYAEAGQAVTLALKRIKRGQVRKGMVLVARGETPPVATRRFEGQCLILYHNTMITSRYQAMMHIGAARQTVQIEKIVEKQAVRTGDRATLRFRFMARAEYIHVGDRFLFREGRTKALGVVTRLLPNDGKDADGSDA